MNKIFPPFNSLFQPLPQVTNDIPPFFLRLATTNSSTSYTFSRTRCSHMLVRRWPVVGRATVENGILFKSILGSMACSASSGSFVSMPMTLMA